MNPQNQTKKEDKKAQLEWLYIQSSIKNETVLLGMLLGIDLYSYLEHREKDGGLIPCLKMDNVEPVSPEKLAEQTKVFLDRKIELLKAVGDTNPNVFLVSEKLVSDKYPDGKKPEGEDAKKDFWELYLKLEEYYEAGIVPTVIGDHNGIVPSYEIVQKPKLSPKEESKETIDKEEKVIE